MGKSLTACVLRKNPHPRPLPIFGERGYRCRLAVVFFVAASALAAEGQDRRERPLSKGVRVIRDIPYVPGGHERQKLDLYLPDNPPGGGRLLPVIVWVHGGAWLGGTKSECPALPYVARGYAVASVGYRLSQHATFPAQIHDCKAAVRWLRANAEAHGLDPDRFGAWGPSAGGHLVSLLGTGGGVEALEGELGEHRGVSSRVRCVVDWFGPSDLTQMARQAPPTSRIDHDAPDSPEARLIGGPVQRHKDEAAKANPITYITNDDPPFLIFHGTADDIVPLGQSELLVRALRDAGVQVTFVPVEGAGHGGPPFNTPEVRERMEAFFDRHLTGEQRR